jgi:hypothetical protein
MPLYCPELQRKRQSRELPSALSQLLSWFYSDLTKLIIAQNQPSIYGTAQADAMFKAQKGLITVFWSVPELTPPDSAFKDFQDY